MQFTIEGTPIALKRTRISTKGSFIRCYDSQKKEKYDLSLDIIKKLDECKDRLEVLNSKYISLNINFYLPIPKTKQKKIKEGDFCNTIPDLSNLVKFYEDIFNKLLFADDRYIVELHSEKHYSKNPRTVIMITNLEENPCYTDTLTTRTIKRY